MGKMWLMGKLMEIRDIYLSELSRIQVAMDMLTYSEDDVFMEAEFDDDLLDKVIEECTYNFNEDDVPSFVKKLKEKLNYKEKE